MGELKIKDLTPGQVGATGTSWLWLGPVHKLSFWHILAAKQGSMKIKNPSWRSQCQHCNSKIPSCCIPGAACNLQPPTPPLGSKWQQRLEAQQKHDVQDGFGCSSACSESGTFGRAGSCFPRKLALEVQPIAPGSSCGVKEQGAERAARASSTELFSLCSPLQAAPSSGCLAKGCRRAGQQSLMWNLSLGKARGAVGSTKIPPREGLGAPSKASSLS